jgi:hypothetical protein
MFKTIAKLLFCFCILFGANATEKKQNIATNSSAAIKQDFVDYFTAKMDRDTIVALVSRAYEFGQGAEKFCSPEVSISNLGSVGVRMISVSIFYKKNNSHIGSSISRMSIDPRDTTTRGYYQLETKSCNGITGLARVDVCVLRSGKDCSGDVVFADSGKIPLQIIKND